MRAESFCWSPERVLEELGGAGFAHDGAEMGNRLLSRVMPMPLSRMVMVPSLESASILISSSGCPSDSSVGVGNRRKTPGDRWRSGVRFEEMSSRRKISLWLYREWIISFSRSRTSAWKPNVCFSAGFSCGRIGRWRRTWLCKSPGGKSSSQSFPGVTGAKLGILGRAAEKFKWQSHQARPRSLIIGSSARGFQAAKCLAKSGSRAGRSALQMGSVASSRLAMEAQQEPGAHGSIRSQRLVNGDRRRPPPSQRLQWSRDDDRRG